MTDPYDASHITVLEGLAPVRERPAMYIGSTDTRGLHHLVYEVVDNSIDEALAGYCTLITVKINKDGSIAVIDNGSYKVSGGLHGVCVSVVNALSNWLSVRVYRDGNVYEMRFSQGKPTSSLSTREET